MNSMSTIPAARSRGLGMLLIAEALLAFAPIAVLAPAIGWPASLRNPAADQLAAVAAQADAVAIGYGLYLLYSILVAPVMIGLAVYAAAASARPIGAWAATAAGFAVASALARSIGILRWLTVMPTLAAGHAAADGAAQAQIALLFNAIHSWGGGIGEVLGVSLFMALSMGALAVAALQSGRLPRWLGASALLVALLLGSLALPALGIALRVPVALAVSLLSLWMLAAGVWMLRRPA